MFSEWSFATNQLHMPYDRYLKETSDEMRVVNVTAYQLQGAKQAYWNTPTDKRWNFFGT